MRLALRIASRYLFSKKSHSAINIISMISVCGVALITAALICTLSVYNGFSQLIGSLLSDIQPEIKILPVEGKTIDGTLSVWNEIAAWDEVAYITPVIEETALAVYDRQSPVTVKGIPDDYNEGVPLIKTILTGDYTLRDDFSQKELAVMSRGFKMRDEITSYAIIGAGVAVRIEAGANYSRPIELYAPRRQGRINLANPAASFVSQSFYVSSVFYTNQAQYDDNLIYIPLDDARTLFDYPTEATAYELCTVGGASTQRIMERLRDTLGEQYIVQDRLMQNGESFRWIQIEKWITFLILAFILLIATFNIVGSLSMLIVDKQDDIATLRKLGADDRLVTNIFMAEGWLISMLGALSGLFIGILLCWLQQEFGILRMGDSGAFIVDAYPVQLQWGDTFAVTAIVLLLGAVTAGYPARILRRKLEQKRS
ncbi:MAG: FtsX-like permease family protein [Bacteroidales bacterium]|nr:FtsX-like permease family protein [Bacteroidales bacterium]